MIRISPKLLPMQTMRAKRSVQSWTPLLGQLKFCKGEIFNLTMNPG